MGQPKTPADQREERGGEERGGEERGGEERGGVGRGGEGRGGVGRGGEERGGEGRGGGGQEQLGQAHESPLPTYCTHPRQLGREASCAACQPSPPDSQ